MSNNKHTSLYRLISIAGKNVRNRMTFAGPTRTIGTVYAYTPEEEKENAFIVRACNNFDGLLEALKALSALYDTDEGCRSTPEYISARAVIAKATGAA